MTKIMLVEDDKSLREIYSIRLVAEGYNIVTAGDGEEALAMAVQEKPDLIVSDVMMPKISGFDMLDILRSTPETAEIRVIMMTALSSEDQRKRGESLGANKYLVKSQVGIEDVVNAVHEVLGDKPIANGQANIDTLAAIQANAAANPPAQAAPAPTAPPPPQTTPAPAPETAPVAPQPAPAPTPEPQSAPAPIPQPAPAPEPITAPAPQAQPVMPATPPVPPAPLEATAPAEPVPAAIEQTPPPAPQPAPEPIAVPLPPPTSTPQPAPVPLPPPTTPALAPQPPEAPQATVSERVLQPMPSDPAAEGLSMAEKMAAELGDTPNAGTPQ